jgi:formate hydrogenlyase subunit 3/multisubunit Na+/H+ antiporter MnhD subunit
MWTGRRNVHDGSDDHLLVAPVLLPLATAALMLLLGEGRRQLKAVVNVLSTALGLAIAVSLLLGVAAARRRRRSASTCRATGRCPSASCWWPTGCRR